MPAPPDMPQVPSVRRSRWAPLHVPSLYGRYEILERLGEGGMAEVYRARPQGQKGLLSSVVVKRLRPHLANLPTTRQLFEEEAKLGAKVRHPNIVQVYERGELSHGEMFIVMEYIEGTDLRWLLAGARRRKRQLPVWLALHIAIEVLEALVFLAERKEPDGKSKSVIHCDVTPENVFISSGGIIKLGDFGVAFQGTDLDLKTSKQHRGKLPYMSPEQAACEPLDPRTDVFSTAAVLWESLTGARLIKGHHLVDVLKELKTQPKPNPSRYNPNVPPGLDGILQHALHPERRARLGSARVFQQHLRTCLQRLAGTVRSEDVVSAMQEVLRPDPKRLPASPRAKPPSTVSTADTLPEIVAPGYVPPTPSPPASSSEITPVVGYVPPSLDVPSSSSGVTPIVPFARIPAVPVPAGAEGAHNLFSEPTPINLDIPVVAAPAPRAVTRVTADLPAHPPPVSATLPRWWLSSPAGLWGPMPPMQALTLLQRLPLDMVGQVSISPDGDRWVPLLHWATLLGFQMVQDTPASNDIIAQGTLDERSVVGLFGEAFHTRASGCLILVRNGIDGVERVEIDILAGRWLDLRANPVAISAWAQLIEKLHAEQDGHAEATLHRILHENRPAHKLLEPTALELLHRLHRAERQRQFATLMKWRAGQFRFEERVSLSGAAPESLLSMLPFIIARNIGDTELRHRLKQHLNMAFEPTAHFEATLDEMGIFAEHRSLLSAFSAKRSLAEATERLAQAVDLPRAWAWAYVLIELRALAPTSTIDLPPFIAPREAK